VLVIDASSSMRDPTAAGRPKIDAARQAAGVFLDHLLTGSGDQAAVVAFNHSAALLQPLTDDRSLVDAALSRVQIAFQTRIDLGVEAARAELASNRRRPDNLPVMIVLSDGRANPVGPEAAVEQARLAKSAGVVVFIIGLGADLDDAALLEMAGGEAQFYRAPDAEQLAGIYRRIAAAIPCPPAAFWGRR